MATDPWSLSTTAASNVTIGGVSAAEGILPANLNNLDRALAAGLRELVKVIGGEITAGGTADAITITTGLSWSAYAAGQLVWFEAASTNTTNMTVAVDGLAAKAITDNAGSALTAGAVQAGGFYGIFYEAGSDNFHIVNPEATGFSGPGSSTDNAVARFDGTGGSTVQDSGVTVDDSDNLSVPGSVELGHASDTTFARVSAGVASIEGNNIYTAGTDIAGADGGTIGKQTIWVPAGAMVAAATSGAASGSVEEATNAHNYATLDFDASSDEYATFEIAMPKGWDEGTITFQAYWSSTAADTDGVSWALQAVAVADGDDSDVAYGTAVVVDDANQSNAGDILISAESGAVTVAGSPAAGEITQFRIFRDVSDSNDTATEDAQLRGVKIFYTIDTGIDD